MKIFSQKSKKYETVRGFRSDVPSRKWAVRSESQKQIRKTHVQVLEDKNKILVHVLLYCKPCAIK